MRKQLILALVLVGGLSTLAQAQGRYDDRRYDDRGYGRGYGNSGRNEMRRGGDPVRSVIDTLYQIERRTRADRHERDHMRNAVKELTQFDQRRMQGRFDRGSLNDAINHMRDLAQADQLHPRERSRIAAHLNDLYRLREGGRW
jgi:hypothetical protein